MILLNIFNWLFFVLCEWVLWLFCVDCDNGKYFSYVSMVIFSNDVFVVNGNLFVYLIFCDNGWFVV